MAAVVEPATVAEAEEGPVRWDDLFRDLEAQLEAADTAELMAEVQDRTRAESGSLSFLDRALGAVGQPVTIRLQGGAAVAGVLQEVGSTWLLVGESNGRQALLPVSAVLSVSGLTRTTGSASALGRVFARLGLASALRGLARDRAVVSLGLVDGRLVNGTIDRVGADFVEISSRAQGEVRDPGASGGVETLPFSALALVRSRP